MLHATLVVLGSTGCATSVVPQGEAGPDMGGIDASSVDSDQLPLEDACRSGVYDASVTGAIVVVDPNAFMDQALGEGLGDVPPVSVTVVDGGILVGGTQWFCFEPPTLARWDGTEWASGPNIRNDCPFLAPVTETLRIQCTATSVHIQAVAMFGISPRLADGGRTDAIETVTLSVNSR